MATKDNFFTFIVPDLDKKEDDFPNLTFQVRLFEGKEALSKPYKFIINLVSKATIEGAKILNKAAKLKIHRDQSSVTYHGIVTEFQQGQKTGDTANYQAVLSPKWSVLSLSKRSDVFVNLPFWSDGSESIMKTILNRANIDYRVALQGTYDPPADPETSGYNRWSYVCQYEESDLDFLSRLMEREGIYYYFDPERGQIVFTDSLTTHKPSNERSELVFKAAYEPATGPSPDAIHDISVRDWMVPKKVVLKNYNYEKANLNVLSVEEELPGNGEGEVVSYGENFHTEAEGRLLAKIRKQELLCKGRLFFGESTAVPLMPGMLVKLNHHDTVFDGEFLVRDVTHAGSQPLGWLTQAEPQAGNDPYSYTNYFYFPPATYDEKIKEGDSAGRENETQVTRALQFRPERLAPKPKITGTMNAFITGDCDIPLDKKGRYKVELPFTRDAEKGTMKRSVPIRMASPYAGVGLKGYGMHLPLHKGAEVILSFRDGDPDLPVISGAAFNPQNLNPVTFDNQHMNVIETSGGNKIVMDDTPNQQYMHLFSPFGETGSWIYLGQGKKGGGAKEGAFKGDKGDKGDTGTKGDKGDRGEKGESGAEHVVGIKSSGNKRELVIGQNDSYVIGSENAITIGSKLDAMVGSQTEITLGMKSIFEAAGTLEFKGAGHFEFGTTTERIKDHDDLLGITKVSIGAGLPPGQSAVLSNTVKSMTAILAGLGALSAAGGAELASIWNPQLDDETKNNPNGWSMLGSGGGLLAQIIALIVLLKTVKTSLVDVMSKIEMDKHGIEIKTGSAADEGIKIHTQSDGAKGIQIGLADVDGLLVADGEAEIPFTSSVKLIPGNGEAIIMEKNQGGKIRVDETGVEIQQQNDGGKVSVTDDGVCILKEEAGFVNAGAHRLIMGYGEDSILNFTSNAIELDLNGTGMEITADTIHLKWKEGDEIKAGPIQVDRNGFIKLG